MRTLHGLLADRARRTPDGIAYTFVDGDTATDRTWGELYERAGLVAHRMREAGCHPGDRALLLFHEGLDSLDALFGCLRAGVLAVPAHPPDPRRLDRTLPRARSILHDAEPRVILATADVHDATHGDEAFDAAVRITLPLAPPEGPLEHPPDAAPPLAYLQYTSGSTAEPKGVMIGHDNLLHQLADFDSGYAHTTDAVIVSWIPSTHDLGLVYGRLMGLYKGLRTVFFAPAAFMATPRRWLELLTAYRGTHSPSPNFGFEYAARRVTDLDGLDLTHVRVLLNGAEPIRRRSETAFVERFAAAGLKSTALTHAMGMSESTAKIVTEPIERTPVFLTVQADALADNRVVPVGPGTVEPTVDVASNGRTLFDTVARIVDPETLEDLGEDRVGELWVGGTTVAKGYWQRPDATNATFRAHTEAGDGPFLRTGDLGFLHGGELYLVGRRKDVLIVRGQNHHPQDLEWAFDGAHPALRPGGSAAFPLERDGVEHIGIVAEVRPDRVGDPDAVFGAIRGRLADLGLVPDHLALIAPGALPKTSSGKIRRREARRRFVHDELEILHRWDRSERAPASAPTGTGDVHTLLRAVTAELLGLEADEVDTDQPFRELGLDSVLAVELVERVGGALDQSIPATWLWDHPTIDSLAAALTAPEGSDVSPGKDVAEMTDAEAEAALLAELEDL